MKRLVCLLVGHGPTYYRVHRPFFAMTFCGRCDTQVDPRWHWPEPWKHI